MTSIGVAPATGRRDARVDVQGALLLAGLLSSSLYVATDVICSALYPGYEYTNQAVSELSAIGAPTAALWRA